MALLLALQILAGAPRADPFAFFAPWATLSAADRQQLEKGEPIAHTLSAKDGEVAVIAVIPVHIDGDRLVAWVRRIEALKKSRYVLAIHRVSSPPRLDDFAGLALDADELNDLLECKPGDCGLKLSAAEMTALGTAAASGGDDRDGALQMEFRRIALERVQAHLACRPPRPYEDHDDPVWPAREFASVLDHAGFIAARLPALGGYLRGARCPPSLDLDSFVYWSKERVASKAVVSATDVGILRGHDGVMPDALVAARQIFATHYMNASLGITALVRGRPGGPNYLVYINRTQLDMLHGPVGAFIRPFVQQRLKAEAADVLEGLRHRLESGEP